MKSSILIAASTVLALPVFAGEPAPAQISYQQDTSEMSWTGFYLGVQVGGAFNSGDEGKLDLDAGPDGDYGDFFPAFGDNFSGDFDESITGGLFAGYDHQFGRFVVGGILDINFADINQRQSGFSSTPAFYHEDREIDFLSTGRVRLGYAFSDRVLGYITGGLAYANVDYEFNTNTPAAVSTRKGESNDFGYVVGAGVEARLTQTISLGLEYLYTNLGNSDFRTNLSGVPAFSPTPGSSTDARGSDRDLDFHQVQLKLAYRF